MHNCTLCGEPVEKERVKFDLKTCYRCASETDTVYESTPLGLRAVKISTPKVVEPVPRTEPVATLKRWRVATRTEVVATFDTLDEAFNHVAGDTSLSITDAQKNGVGRVWPTPGLPTRKRIHPVNPSTGGGARNRSRCLNRHSLRC
jgi:hypothetical protein